MTSHSLLPSTSGDSTSACRATHQEFLRFLRGFRTRHPDSRQLRHPQASGRHVVDKHPRVHFHFIPTSSSWLNLVERFFSELTTRQLKRLAVTRPTNVSIAETITPHPLSGREDGTLQQSKPSIAPSQVFPSRRGALRTFGMTTNVTARQGFEHSENGCHCCPRRAATGEVVHECLPRRPGIRSRLRFLRKIERSVASELDIHVILDNYATHKLGSGRQGVASTNTLGSTSTSFPGSSSWLNLVSSASSANSRLVVAQAPRRHIGVDQPNRGDQPLHLGPQELPRFAAPITPHTLCGLEASAQSIIAKVSKAKETLATQH